MDNFLTKPRLIRRLNGQLSSRLAGLSFVLVALSPYSSFAHSWEVSGKTVSCACPHKVVDRVQTHDLTTVRQQINQSLSQTETRARALTDPFFKEMFDDYLLKLKGDIETGLRSPSLESLTPECHDIFYPIRKEAAAIIDVLVVIQNAIVARQINLSGTNSDPQAMPILDPKLSEAPFISLFKLGDQAPLTGANDQAKLAQYLADQLDTMARIYVAGTVQLRKDKRTDIPADCKIRGMYDGYFPKLLSGTCAQPVELNSFPGAVCNEDGTGATQNTGIVNPMNRWFKGPDGTYKERIESGRLFSHRSDCQGVRLNKSYYKGFMLSRGYIVQIFMQVMERMKSQIMAGKIPSSLAFGIPPVAGSSSATMRGHLNAGREYVRTQLDVTTSGLANAQGTRSQYEACGLSAISPLPPAANQVDLLKTSEGQTLRGMQTRMCLIASMRIKVETQFTTQYAYLIWSEVVADIYSTLLIALSGYYG